VYLSREDKVLFPGDGITKGDLVQHYQSVADHLLPHLRDRPLTLQRFPDGIAKDGFYQKEAPDYFPKWIRRTQVPLMDGGEQEQVVVSKRSDLAYLANQGVVTLHPWLSRDDDLDFPDRMIFDLDPADETFEPVKRAARQLQRLLEKLGLKAFLMVTGSRGAHVWVPLRRGPDFDEVRGLAQEIAQSLAEGSPEEFTTEVRKEKRDGRLFLDVARNAFAQTAVAPYALRPLPGAPVATPLDWSELERRDLGSATYTMESLPRRLVQKGDPWHGMGRHGAGLQGAREKLARLKEMGGQASLTSGRSE
jgi:bifunctional non-homologous end joining protein LigD